MRLSSLRWKLSVIWTDVIFVLLWHCLLFCIYVKLLCICVILLLYLSNLWKFIELLCICVEVLLYLCFYIAVYYFDICVELLYLSILWKLVELLCICVELLLYLAICIWVFQDLLCKSLAGNWLLLRGYFGIFLFNQNSWMNDT
jgi:hypothetical protein